MGEFQLPIVNLQILEGRSNKQIKEVIQNMTETISVTLEVPKDRVRIIVTEIPKTHWGTGGVLKSDQ